MKVRMAFMKEGGFTTPAAAVALLLACALAFVCIRGVVIGSRSAQIQYVADAGALAADNVVAEFVTTAQVVDAMLLSFSLLAIAVYGASAVAAFIPGGQGAATELAQLGTKIFKARDSFADSAIRGLEAAQKALPALCAIRCAEVVQANARASGISYVGIALTSPMQGASVSLSDDAEAEVAMEEIEGREGEIQEKSVQQEEAQKREDAAKIRAWLADCGRDGMNMFERAQSLSSISAVSNPYFSSHENWSFSVPINRATAYYEARYYAEPGASAHGSPEDIAESVARKQFYAYAREQVSQGRVETTESGAKIPHLVQLARNTSQIKETSLYTDARYPVSENAGVRHLHAYESCPTYLAGSSAGYGAVCEIDSGALQKCPSCNFSATTLGRVPSASTSIGNGFEYHYLEVVEASRDYAQAVEDGEQAARALKQERESVADLLSKAASSLAGKRYDPQPPGRYGCVCIVIALEASLSDSPFLEDGAMVPARLAISGATLAPDPADDEGNVISGVAEGLLPKETLGAGATKLVFGAWGTMLDVYGNGISGVKMGFRKVLGAIPLVGTALSDQAVSAFEGALSSAGIEPAHLETQKPALVNTTHILERDDGKISDVLSHMKQAASIYGAISVGDVDALVQDIQAVPEVSEFLDEHGLTIASISLSDLGLGSGERKLYFPAPANLAARLEEVRSQYASMSKR